LDCLTRERIMMDMFASFDEMQMQLSGNTQKLLIEYRTNNIRAGYLLATVEGKKLIIRTFLFITQSATPEGDALHKNAKLHRDAIAFLNFDRLSTFMTPEIQENKRLRCFFKEAGCQSLLELNKIFADKDITITKHPNTTLIEDYLGIDLTKEFIEEEEPGENEDENEEEYETGDEAESESENEEPALEAEPAGEADPNKIKEVVIKIHWTKRIILGIITYSLRIFDLLATQNVKSSIKPGVKNYTDPDEIVALDKDDKFSSSKLSPTGRFFGWVIVLTLMISFTIITLPYYLIKRLIKGKKSQANLMDYRQFAGGRKRNKGRK